MSTHEQVEGIASDIKNLQIVESRRAEENVSLEDDLGDDDLEDAWEVGGLRGFLQKADEPWMISRQYFPSKAGGTPAWLDPVNLPTSKRAKCDVCDEPLQFVLQVYAPDKDNEAAFHRTLFVFLCTSLACLQQDLLQQQRRKEKRVRSVKVFRSQLPRANSFYSSDPPSNDGSEPLFNQGAPLCWWCGTWKGDKRCGGCRQTRYCCRSHQMNHWKGDHAAFCRSVQEQDAVACGGKTLAVDADRTEVTPTCSVAPVAKLWPEFELFDDELESFVEPRAGTSKLVEDYERRKREGKDYSARDVEDLEESTPEEQHWAAFQEKIAESPAQVLWYCRSSDAKPLWPRLEGQPQTSDIPTCSLCGEERSFEFQILPQLLYFFDIKDNPDSLDWGTIAVYSCARSCSIQGYCEEFAWVQPGFC